MAIYEQPYDIPALEKKVKDALTEMRGTQVTVNKLRVEVEEKERTIRRLNSEFFSLYNKVRFLTTWSIISSICFLILIIISFFH